jgi:hypothetical protein
MKYLSLVLAIIVSVNCDGKSNLENTHTRFQLESGKQLIFMVSWIGEKGEPVVLQ